MCYAMVDSIPHGIVFGMHHTVCIGIRNEHVVYILTMWNAFDYIVGFCGHVVCFSKSHITSI